MGKVHQENLSLEALKAEVKRKPKAGAAPKPKVDRSLRAQFRAKMATINIEQLKKPWMAAKSFVLITTEADLIAYVDSILNDESIWQQPYYDKPELMPVVAVDTETHGLDTRVMVDFELKWDAALGREVATPIYELNIEIAGICLSADGIKGVYIPLFHEDGKNVPVEIVQRELQRLFDRSHLLFYNAKFDREVLRQTVGLVFRDWPFYEDIQALYFSNDPKAKLDDDTFTGRGEGLKGLSEDLLNFKQIDLEEIGKVKAHLELSIEEQEELYLRPNWVRTKKKDAIVCETCGELARHVREQIVRNPDGSETFTRKAECEKPECSTKITFKKAGPRVQYVPFAWIPTEIALWYAASDAICTWLLWWHTPQRLNEDDPEPDAMHVEAQKRSAVHKIDGQMTDTLAWMERQRMLVDVERHARLVKWSNAAQEVRRQKLRELANRDGWQEGSDDDGTVFPDTVFSADSKLDLPKLLFDIKGFLPTKVTDEGHRSCDKSVLQDLRKLHPHDEFLNALAEYKGYVALHPEKVSFDKRDNTARIYLKQSVVAGGRLAASGGEFLRDGGVNINIQAVKKVGGNWWVKGDVLTPDFVAEEDVEAREESELDSSCFLEAKKDEVVASDGEILEPTDQRFAVSAETQGFRLRDGKWMKKAPGILRNHIANYLGYAICLIPSCKSCAEKHGVLIAKTKLDCNQIINLRALFIAEKGWTLLSSDYSNIEVRGAANISGEPELQKIFLEGDGDHHALTASKVFREFNDPNTSKARRKELRAIAKIINFALQYGGSEFTIYQNLKAIIPDITFQRAKEMVDDYWRGVPKFAAWCHEKMQIAKQHMVCYTTTGRVIKFKSAMKALRIEKPSKEQLEMYFHYMRLRKRFHELEDRYKESKAEVDRVQCEVFKKKLDELWNDKDTGVRNASEYNKFMGKIQRVAVNAPVQGLAGDLMRIALNKIRIWATRMEPWVQAVLRVHNSVHDEVDYTIKNRYLPFVVPRITRLMKLRALHASQKWPVPIESDTEYGDSWDVKYHLTGDDSHKPSAWTDVPGMEEYLPPGFTLAVVDKLVRAIASGVAQRRDKAYAWLEGLLHKRALLAVPYAFWLDDKKEKPVTDQAIIRKQLIVAMQLHEYWSIDEVPDDQDATMERLVAFEQRCGLTEADRGFMPPDGWLFSVPLDRVRRKQVPVLGPAPEIDPDAVVDEPVEPQQTLFAEQPDEVVTDCNQLNPEMSTEPEADFPTQEEAPAPAEVPEETVTPMPEADDDDEMFYPTPKQVVKVAPPAPTPPPVVAAPAAPKLPQLRDDLSEKEILALIKYMGKDMGTENVPFRYRDGASSFRRCVRTEIPAEYLSGPTHA